MHHTELPLSFSEKKNIIHGYCENIFSFFQEHRSLHPFLDELEYDYLNPIKKYTDIYAASSNTPFIVYLLEKRKIAPELLNRIQDLFHLPGFDINAIIIYDDDKYTIKDLIAIRFPDGNTDILQFIEENGWKSLVEERVKLDTSSSRYDTEITSDWEFQEDQKKESTHSGILSLFF